MEPNATHIVAVVRHDTYFQIIQALRRLEITDYLYSTFTTEEAIVKGRFELVIPDTQDARKVIDGIKRFGTGYTLPDVHVSSWRVFYEHNG